MFLLLIVLLAFRCVTQFTPSFFLHLLRNHNSAPKKTSRFPYCPCIISEILISANIDFSGIAILSKRKSIIIIKIVKCGKLLMISKKVMSLVSRDEN